MNNKNIFGFSISIAGCMCFAVAQNTIPEKGFSPEWVKNLIEKGQARWYAGQELQFIGQNVNGLYSGQIYLGGDGRLWNWDIFNRRPIDPGKTGDKFYLNPMKPGDNRQVSSGFIVECDGQAHLLDARSFPNLRFRSEFPISRIDFHDESSPLKVDLEAFSPFVPTRSDLSEYPATLLNYRFTNTSTQAVKFRLGAWLENAAFRESVAEGVLTPASETLGDSGVLITARKPTRIELHARPPVVLQNFESGYGEWKAEGDAFSDTPFPSSTLPPSQGIQGIGGEHFANSCNTRVNATRQAADELTGTLTSPAFTINRKFLTFNIAGSGQDESGVGNGLAGVRVFIDQEEIGTYLGKNDNVLRPTVIDLSAHQGKSAYIQVIDSKKEGWGHVQVDDFILRDQLGSTLQKAFPGDGEMALSLLGDKAEVLAPYALPSTWTSTLSQASEKIPANSAVIRSGEFELAPNQSIEVSVAVAWHFPNAHLANNLTDFVERRAHLRHYYAKRFPTVSDVIKDLQKNGKNLIATTRLWRDTWYDSTLPVWFLDRTMLPTNSLNSAACIHWHDAGSPAHDNRYFFLEGVYLGSGTCSHVTHYEQAFGRLFPDAAKAQRSVVDYGVPGWQDSPAPGYVAYRAEWNVGHHFGIPHAIDGHAGTVTRVYREHCNHSDNSFLKPIWPRVKRSIDFMIDQDAGRGYFEKLVLEKDRNTEPDGVLAGPQYNTLDKIWDGDLPWTSGLYMASLRAGAAMARDLGDDAFASLCDAIANRGMEELTKRTFRPDFGYFVQNPIDKKKYVNVNIGCHIDQLMGHYWTGQNHLAPVFPENERRSALAKIFEYNVFSRLADHREKSAIKVARTYAFDDEPGTILASFPHGGENETSYSIQTAWDALAVGYFSECMTGFSYQFAASLMDEGMTAEALTVCRSIHDRYAESPLRRNPFNEIEYGNHYTRTMSAYGVYIAASGFSWHGPSGTMGFDPKLNPSNFKGAFTTGSAWGSYEQQTNVATLTMRYGTLKLSQLNLPKFKDRKPSISLAGKKVQFPVELAAGDQLRIQFLPL